MKWIMNIIKKICWFLLKKTIAYEKRIYDYGEFKDLSITAIMFNDFLFRNYKDKKLMPITIWIGFNQDDKFFTGGAAPICFDRESILRILLYGINYWNKTKWHDGTKSGETLKQMGVEIIDKENDIKENENTSNKS